MSPLIQIFQAPPPPLLGRLDKGRKVALLLAYCGAGYYGIQIQKDYPTIESELLSALVKCKCLTQEQADTPNKIQFQRAARTDKGVSALGNIISLKISILYFLFDYLFVTLDDVVDVINKELPNQIRVLSYIRTTKGFNSKNFCDSRTYMYMIPTYAFTPVNQVFNDDYRISDENFTLLNTVLSKYKGTHNFHNYTSGIKPTDASANRFIIKFEADKPTIEDDIEFITLKVTGQSFMLHHIRKMVALTICVVKGLCGIETIEKSWLHDKMDVPRAPSEGLFLCQTHYTGYNRRYGTDGIHDPLDWSHCQVSTI
ncbi:hypothetical protein LOTGIDRAFT_117320 [Lottia gigantea]|uniref:Pseudouridylate synthase 1 homolog n=1 Tax=Lottia gigantea TaxID=225164 RepID=V4C133_LOTGI|nr:hypothetical protein LOTGIDRAFT_117320 [Lottia gigantea]ESO95174.1 hypothetical protein LOTGIDRAFT_117320 [Lottia gigantea]